MEKELLQEGGERMLKIENLVVNYGYINVLRGISFEVHKGEIITLIGSNGAGKTTTLNSISGLKKKESGKVFFKGENISNLAPHKIVKMGMCHVPEGRKIFPALTVKENLMAGTFGKPELKKDQIESLCEEIYTIFPRLKERMNQNGGTLSGGEQQMLAIARGMMMEPDIIMLDEPSLGLAPIIVEEIFELIQKIRDDGKTILLIEQNATMALSIADRGYVMENGEIIMDGKGQELLENERVQAAYLGA